jgi:O-antigen biosynthesis protein
MSQPGRSTGLLKRRWQRDLQRAFDIIKHEGFPAFVRRAGASLRERALPRTYKKWIARYDTPSRADRRRMAADIGLRAGPTISLIMAVGDGDQKSLHRTIRSVQAQLYPRWQLCVGVDVSIAEELRKDLDALAGQNGRIRIAHIEDPATWANKANGALALASGDFVAPIDPGDALAEQALYWVAKEVLAYPQADLIFSDEDTIRGEANRFDPWFKSDWNPELMLSCNAFGRLGVYRRDLVERLGGFRAAFAGAEEHELVLRCARASEASRIRHVPRVLYHRRGEAQGGRTGSDYGEAGRRAITEHLAVQGIAAAVRRSRDCGYQVAYPTPSPNPQVSILVATTARPDLAGPCLRSLFERTSYDNWEVLLLVSGRVRQSPERAALLQRFAERPNLRVIEYPDRPFNYSWANNLGAAQASGEILCFLNDDTEVITPDWLEQLVARVSLLRVAAAGPMLYYPDGTIQHAGVILGLGGIAGHACHREPRGARGYFGRACLEQQVSCVTAACMAIRAEVFRALGGFDEGLPLAYNDVDLCLRLRAAGWRIIWTPAAELMHHESASLGRHDAGAKAKQFACDVALMRQRWGSVLEADPFYNCNLSLERAYRLAFPPRHSATASSSGELKIDQARAQARSMTERR